VIGISGGTPYALAVLHRLGDRVETTTILSGMGPARLRGSLRGMDRRRRLFFELGSRAPWLARRALDRAGARFRADPRRFLKALVRTWSIPDQRLFEREDVFDLFLKDLEQVFIQGNGGIGMAQELRLYRDFGFRLRSLPADKRVTLWQGLDDTIVPPEMAWRMVQALPNREARFIPGGHFVAIDIAEVVTDRIRERLDGRE